MSKYVSIMMIKNNMNLNNNDDLKDINKDPLKSEKEARMQSYI